MKVLGIDIGTTTVSSLLLDSCNGKILSSKTLTSESFIEQNGNKQVQSVAKIFDLVHQIYAEFSQADVVGLTCQMHGIMYIDAEGNPLSNLYTWQDDSGNDLYKDNKTYAEYMTSLTGYNLASGFGLVTHFVHKESNSISFNNTPYSICTIGDYVGMKLAQAKKPLMHITNAASLGLFNVKKHCFDVEAIQKLGINPSILPEVTAEYTNYPNSKISVAIGDNQASFMGSVANMGESLLVNIGTSGQISYLGKEYRTCDTLEVRPFDKDSYLFVGASLCGGRAYAMLATFMKKIAKYLNCSVPNMYDIIDTMAANVDESTEKLLVNTKFSGTRQNPKERGAISNIGTANFLPENLAAGVLEGITAELYDMYDKDPKSMLIASGNALRKNAVFCKIVSKQFGLPLKIPTHTEEASYGAALFAMVANGIYSDIQSAQKIIQYK